MIKFRWLPVDDHVVALLGARSHLTGPIATAIAGDSLVETG